MLKKCLILAVSLITIQSITYAADTLDHEADRPSSPKQTEVTEEVIVDSGTPSLPPTEHTPVSQPKDDEVTVVVKADATSTQQPAKKKKSSCFSCFGSAK